MRRRPKQKWTLEEEAALHAGVEKHGPGWWRIIQTDPEFRPVLSSRSNIGLKVVGVYQPLSGPRLMTVVVFFFFSLSLFKG